MTRKEYDLVFQAFKSYRVYMTDAEEALANEPEINGVKSLNFS